MVRYLDCAATTFPKPECVLARMDEVNRTLAVNAGRGVYREAREAAQIIDETRKRLADLVFSDASRVIFSPSASIALNQILRGIEWKAGDVVYLSPYEHNAVSRILYDIQKKMGIRVYQMPLKENLEIDLDALWYRFSVEKPCCVCVTQVSNVTGYILPVKETKTIPRLSIRVTRSKLGIVYAANNIS